MDMLVHIVLLMLLQLEVVGGVGGGEKMTYLVSFLFYVVFSADRASMSTDIAEMSNYMNSCCG